MFFFFSFLASYTIQQDCYNHQARKTCDLDFDLNLNLDFHVFAPLVFFIYFILMNSYGFKTSKKCNLTFKINVMAF